tara:strand:+ start:169 stop:1128 length:960 start_codon:yes stop_codon:yes gene_type:complete
MILSKCPLRISLIGGSSDLEEYIENEGYGSVISFPCNLYTYNTIFLDKNGYNRSSGEYIVEYTKTEKTKSINKIKNDVARNVLKHFKPDPLKISFYSDIFSHGSGLASSSAYVISLTKAISVLLGKRISSYNICKLALDIERQFNPLTGRQDTFGCGLGGFKRIEFFKNKNTIARPLDDGILSNYDMYLIYTGVKRNSTRVLKSLNLKKVKTSMPLVNKMEDAIQKRNEKDFFNIIQSGWNKKRKTSKLIQSNLKILELDASLKNCDLVKAHKLCGAGGGGYYLAFTEKGADLACHIKNFNKISFKINVDNKGVTHAVL